MKINDVLVEFATQGELDERNMGQPRVAAAKPEILSAVDDGKTITVQVRVPDGTTRSMSNSNPAVIQQWLNVKYGLRFPANIARKFVGMPASMAEQDIDEDLSRRGFLKGLGAAAVAGGVGYQQGRVGVFEEKAAFALGYCEQFLSMNIPNKCTSHYSFQNTMKDFSYWSKRLDSSLRNTDDYALGKSLAKQQVSQYSQEYIKTEEGCSQLIGMFSNYVAQLRENTAPISKTVREESVNQGVAESDLNEKSTSQAQFRTMAAAAHNPAFARKVGIDTDVAQEFHGADRGQDYKDLPKKANESELDEGELDEGWKEKVAAAALAGTMALGSAGAQARITPDAQGNFPSSGKPVATQQATTTAPAIPSTLTKPQAQYDVDTQLLTYKGKQYKWNSDAQATGQGEVVSAPAMSIRSRSMFPTKVELNPNGTYTRASVNEATGRLPDPQNYDSDWDYYNDRDAEEPEDTDSDYENMIDEPSDWFDESRQKVGNMDADAFDDALARMKKLAGAGSLKTVYDPNKRVYKNVPTAQQPAKQPQK